MDKVIDSQADILDSTSESGDLELNETTPLVSNVATSRNVTIRCCTGRFCTKSKAVLLILTWSMVFASFQIGLDPTSLMVAIFTFIVGGELYSSQYVAIFIASIYGPLALIFLLYPLAGFLADVCFGRYKVVLCSLKTVSIIVFVGGCTCGLLSLLFIYIASSHSASARLSYYVLAGATAGVSYLVMLTCYILFSANVIQFGVDQLMDSSNEDSSLFIYWYMWTYYLGVSIARIFWAGFIDCSNFDSIVLYVIPAGILPLFALIILPISLCCMCSRRVRRWFLVEPGSENPYKLVWKVLKFAATHNRPIQRSAFTFCEDELPSRLDLGKSRYGGPFETEAVESVKTFIRIFCLLVALAPFFAIELAAYVNLSVFNLHLVGDWVNSFEPYNYPCQDLARNFLLGSGVLTPILPVVFIPLYIFFLRPFCYKYSPGMFKRMGLGMLLYLVSLLCTFTTDVVGHTEKNPNATCMFTTDYFQDYKYDSPEILRIDPTVLIFQNVFNSLGSLLFYVAAYEFIIAQSPHQMKGLIIGSFFAIKGFSQLIAVAAVVIPFYFWPSNVQLFPSCGFVYYLINIFICLFGFLVYTFVARRYQYRLRDEPTEGRLHQYAENYYERHN